MTDCKCLPPCGPCKDNCPDDWEITEVELLDADECSGPCWGCCSNKCKDNCGINIQSTNECLTVDTSECGVVKITSHCPPIVTAWQNITVDAQPCQEDNCSINYVVSADCKDEKVKACGWDTTPGYLNQKLEAWTGIVIDEINCWGGNASLRIWIKDWTIPECPDIPDVEVNYDGSLLKITQWWDHNHVINISDNATGNFYDNVVMLGFFHNKDKTVVLDGQANSERPYWINTSEDGVWWDMCTWNKKLATQDGIVVKQSGHYFVYWQITVMNNVWVLNRYLNLWRWLIRLTRGWTDYLINTAKHWAYWTSITLKWWKWIDVAQNWTISINRWTVNVWEEWGTYEVNFQNWSWVQPTSWFDWPWMTLNIWVYLDLYEWDKLTLGYRPQSNELPEAPSQSSIIRFVWHNDASTAYQALFWWTTLWLHPITPTLFQKWALRDLI